MGADEFPFRLDLVGSDVALVGGDADLLIDTSELAQLLDVAVHRLVGVVRQGLVVLEGGVFVFLQNIPGNLVQLDGDAVRRLDGRYLDVVALDVAGSTGMSKSIRDTMTKPLPTVFLRSTANSGKPPLTGVISDRVLPARIPGCGSSLRGGPRSTYGGRLPSVPSGCRGFLRTWNGRQPVCTGPLSR